MSRAFVKEAEEAAVLEEIPERIISEHPNFVTARGLWMIEDAIQQLEQGREAARLADDAATLAHINRDLRYWQHRLASAQVVQAEAHPGKVRFGVTVTLRQDRGGERTWTLVGEDEADPTEGMLSWVSPVAKALTGHAVGDTVPLPEGAATITGLTVIADR